MPCGQADAGCVPEDPSKRGQDSTFDGGQGEFDKVVQSIPVNWRKQAILRFDRWSLSAIGIFQQLWFRARPIALHLYSGQGRCCHTKSRMEVLPLVVG